ncbi:unnamed protein product [Ilex paraguariensis]|uniref:Uncharacterized protein n=1 Tax=Ilex paraguariensis TaxID=185542 RepID=A0ABC8T6T0_9AQUA
MEGPAYLHGEALLIQGTKTRFVILQASSLLPNPSSITKLREYIGFEGIVSALETDQENGIQGDRS